MIYSNWKTRTLAMLLAVGLAVSSAPLVRIQVHAENSLEDLKQEKKKAQDKVNDARSQANQAAESKRGLEGQLSSLAEKMHSTQQTIDDNNQKISNLQEELGQAQAQKSERLAAMKLRIRYMYELGDTNELISILFSSENFADFLAKFNYTAQLTKYEQRMIGELENLQREIDAKSADLSGQQDALQENQTRLSGQRDELNGLLANASDDLKAKYADLSGAQKELEDANKAVSDMQEALLAEQKRNEARKLAEAERIARQAEADAAREGQKQEKGQTGGKKNTDSGSSSGGTSDQGGSSGKTDWKTTHAQGQAGTEYWVKAMGYSQQDLDELTNIIFCEAGGEGYQVQLGVGSVVLNRVRSSYFPNSIHSVIFASGQFEPTWIRMNGRWNGQVMFQYFYDRRDLLLRTSRAYQTCRQAALDVLNGKRNTNLCFFWAVSNSKPAGSVIMGKTVFFGRIIQNS